MTPEQLRDNPGFRYNLAAHGVLYLIPIGVAVTFSVVLPWWVPRNADGMDVSRLIALQRLFEQVSTFFSGQLKLSEPKVLGVLAAVYLASVLLASRRGRLVGGLHRVADLYTKYSGPAAAGLATLAAFTFFGMRAGDPAHELRLKVKVTQEGYAEVAKRVEAELSARVVSGLYAKVRARFPAPYQRAIAELPQVGELAASVRQEADSARGVYGVTEPAVERALRAARTGEGGAAEWRVESMAEPAAPPDGITPEQVEAARRGLAGTSADTRAIELVDDGHKKVTLQLEKVVSERIMALTKSLSQAVPMLEPLMAAFADATDKTVQDRMGLVYDRVMATAQRRPGDLPAVIDREVRAVVAAADVAAAVERATPRAEEQAGRHRKLLATLKKGEYLIDRRVDRWAAAQVAKDRREGKLPKALTLSELLKLTVPLDVPKLPDLAIRPDLLRPPFDHRSLYGHGAPYFSRPPSEYRPPPLGGHFQAPKPVAPPRVVPRFR
ncbi:hypothetical protein SAMN05444920_101686 [Nonomuraea solani]|uniref:Uncharacterized protein n=2 Tax=Nonomuraea solani TaxID=1144553 RepID=A0A1H5UX41_9ACTN|nr:hypothetical protein SAMN05444920_101686 [Nonomuraea solani]